MLMTFLAYLDKQVKDRKNDNFLFTCWAIFLEPGCAFWKWPIFLGKALISFESLALFSRKCIGKKNYWKRSWIISEVFQGLIQGWFLPLLALLYFCFQKQQLAKLTKKSVFIFRYSIAGSFISKVRFLLELQTCKG